VFIDRVRVEPIAVIPAHLGAENPSSNGAVSQIIQAASMPALRAAPSRTRSSSCAVLPVRGSTAGRTAAPTTFSRSRKSGSRDQAPCRRSVARTGGLAIDGIVDRPTDEASPSGGRRRRAKVLTTEIAILATNKLHELAGTRSTLAEFNLDRHWRNARTHTLHDPVRWKYFHVGNYALNGIAPPRHAWS